MQEVIYSCESEEAQQTKEFLNGVNEVNNVFGELLRSDECRLRALGRVDRLSQEGVGELAFSESALACLVSIFASGDESDLVAPPGEVTPVSLQVFFEFTILFRVLTNTQDYLLPGNSVFLRRSLVPLGFLVVECADGASHINNGAVLGIPIFFDYATESEIILVGHEVDTTFA
jgi:hypothetical protein